MATNGNKVNAEEQRSLRVGFAKFLFIVIFAVTLLLLARSMVRHHFFSGGQLNQSETAEP
jgi:hypothetical protein